MNEHHTCWDQRFLALAAHVAAWSKDPSTRCGCVLVDTNRRMLSAGYNGFPRGTNDSPGCLADRPTKLARTLHAEANALLFARGPVVGATAYVWPMPPCSQCAAMLAQAGIARVVAHHPSRTQWRRWHDSWDHAETIYCQAGVIFDQLELAPSPDGPRAGPRIDATTEATTEAPTHD